MKILIGDEHPLFRAGVRSLLVDLQEETVFVEVATFGELIDRCRSEERYDLILTNVGLPGWPDVNGIHDVRLLQPDTPLVVISASEKAGTIRAALDQGACGYLPMSSSGKTMRSALTFVLSGGIYVPPMILRMSAEASEDHPKPKGKPIKARSMTQRQCEVLKWLRTGKSTKQIAQELGISQGTVRIHITAVLKALGVRNRTQAAMALEE